MSNTQTIADLKKHVKAKIVGFSALEDSMEVRFREIGFAEGDVVEILHKGLIGGTPLNIRLHGTSIAMRPAEARMINVEVITENDEMSASDKIKARLDEQRKLDESGSCCGACGG